MQDVTRWELKTAQMFDRGDRVRVGGPEETEYFGVVEHDLGGEVVHIHPEGTAWRYPHDAVPVERTSVHLARQTESGDQVQIEIYSNGSTHTLYECCGYDDCRKLILARGLGIPEGEVFDRDRFLVDAGDQPVRITVRELDDPSSCIWCYGCGDFLAHGEGCECEERGHNPEADREPMRPMIVEKAQLLELRPF
jgi:hypothetical protein